MKVVLIFAVATLSPALRAPPRFVQPRMQSTAELLRRDADVATRKRAEDERSLLQEGSPLLAVKQKGAHAAAARGFSSGGGLASASKSAKKKAAASAKKKGGAKKKTATRPPSALAAELKAQGVVRIDGALSPETVAELRDFVDAERLVAEEEVAAGHYDRASRFADLLLLENRADFLLPLRGASIKALHELVGEGSTLGTLVREIMGDGGILQEIACLISEPGSKQQPLHPDTGWTKVPPLYACFVALQDVTLEMGPTVFLPGTHTEDAHALFFGGELQQGGSLPPPIPTEFLKSRKVVLGTLKAGDIAMYNQQVLHCGSANKSDKIRRQFYVSWRNPAVKSAIRCRASMRPAFVGKLTLGDIQKELKLLDGRTERMDDEGGHGVFGQLDEIDRQPDSKKRDRKQAGSLYVSSGPVDLV